MLEKPTDKLKDYRVPLAPMLGWVQLAPVAVQGLKADEGYTRSDASGATKTDTPIIETPQAISVISNTQMIDQGVLTVQDALRYSAGVRADAYGVDSRGDDAFLRWSIASFRTAVGTVKCSTT